ncbi:type II toxin-antitoxin system VapC family toxin [Aquisalimonas sp.]|uniref:type II toxin-antitoxin system VapC family toxin n=1 Tax=Aquisalimonas sp. TaxID=1872621 RepID=UPI0025C484A2|nr:type II toxin-antitoxin system VapC family toxin [Aquisalimonas sp.]
MNVVDSSGWIEYLSGGPNAAFFRDPIEDEEALLIPTLSLFEVYRHLLRHLGRDEALNIIAAMRQGTVMDLDDRLALDAAELSIATKLPLADSIMLAAARAHDGLFWTQDADFEGLENVRLKRKP